MEWLEKYRQYDTVPKLEAHGLVLACNGALTLTKLLGKLHLNLHAVYIFTDAISTLLALDRSPSLFEPPLNRQYAQNNVTLFQIGQITGQKKEEIALFLDQKNFFNPADLLSKFDLQLDTVQDWVSKTQQVFAPQWLQRHPKEYMQQLFEQSQQAVEAQA